MPHTDPGATPAKPQGSSPNALDTPLTLVIGAKGSHTQRPDPHPAMRARRVAIGQTRLRGRAAAGGTIPPLNTHKQLFGVRTCGEGLGLHGRLEAGLLITPLGHVASKAHYPLGGRTVAILDRAESN